MGGGSDHLDRRLLDLAQPSPQPEDPLGGRPHVVGIEQPARRGVPQPALDPRLGHGIAHRQQQVDARADGRDHVDHLGVALRERPHVERVRDREPPEAEVVADQVVHHRPRQGRRQGGVAGDRREREVRRHHDLGARRRSRPGTAPARRGRASPGRARPPPARGGCRGPSPRGPGSACRRPRSPSRACPRTIAADSRATSAGSLPNERIPMCGLARVVGEVADRRVRDVRAHRQQLEAGGPPDPLGEVLVARGAERHVARERRRAAQRVELPALLVGGDQQGRRARVERRRRALDRGGQLADLRRASPS